MSGFHTATICADCDPPVVAISTGYGSRCPKCGHACEGRRPFKTLLDGALARQIIADTAIRSDGDARLLAELARRLLDRVGSNAGGEDTHVDASGYRCTCLRSDQGFGAEYHTAACVRRAALHNEVNAREVASLSTYPLGLLLDELVMCTVLYRIGDLAVDELRIATALLERLAALGIARKAHRVGCEIWPKYRLCECPWEVAA